MSSTKLRHEKSLKKSIFDKIEGVGKKTRSNLLSYFGSIDNIKTASIGDLKKVPNILVPKWQENYTMSLIEMFKLKNIPNYLTLIRILLIPVIILFMK